MASVDFEKSSREYVMFKDFWSLMKKYWIPENNDSYWEELISDTDQFAKRYGNEVFARDLAMALIGELERKAKEKK